jgi:hypothetical protein
MRISRFAALCGVVFLPALGRAQSAVDSAGIRAASLDYLDGWCAADGAHYGDRILFAIQDEIVPKRILPALTETVSR